MITNCSLIFRQYRLSVEWVDGHYVHLPLNYLQKQFNQTAAITGFQLIDDKTIQLQFQNGATVLFDPTQYL